MKMNKHQFLFALSLIIEGLGFGLEILCFILTGFFIWISFVAALMFFICGMLLAVFVGKKIKDNANRNVYK